MRPRLLAAVAALALALTGCTDTGRPSAAPSASRSGGSVAAAFTSPPAWPGVGWTRNGRVVPREEIAAAAGPEHCGWQSATFLTLGWPPGTRAQHANGARQYLRDPRGVLSGGPRLALEPRASLPPDARPSGYRTGDVELWLAADADRYVYFVDARNHMAAERWPRSDPMTLCA